MTAEPLQSLLSRVKEAKPGDRVLVRDLSKALAESVGDLTAITVLVSLALGNSLATLGAAVALAERVLPGMRWKIASESDNPDEDIEGAYWARMLGPRLHFANTPALALLAAILSALIAKEQTS